MNYENIQFSPLTILTGPTSSLNVTWHATAVTAQLAWGMKYPFYPLSIEHITQRAALSIADMRYLGGATTWLGRQRSARCGLEAARVKSALWMEGKKSISPKLTGQ